MNRALLAFLFAAAAAWAAEPAPKLVPRPIPGLPAAKPFETPTDVLMSGFAPPPAAKPSSIPPAPVPVSPAPAAVPAVNEPARILFVHRRDRLPAAMRQRLKALPAEPAPAPARPAAAREMLAERPAAIRIIPKSEVPLLKPPPAPPPPP
jgi:hypothetical protein